MEAQTAAFLVFLLSLANQDVYIPAMTISMRPFKIPSVITVKSGHPYCLSP